MENIKVIATNKKAFHDYFILEKLEAGIVLVGTEVKSLREGRANLKDSYAQVKGGEVVLLNCHISPYRHGNINNHEPTRERKLLLHHREIKRLIGKTEQRGFTLIPLRIYFKRAIVKVELGLVKGKKFYDKRRELREKAIEREVQAAMKEKYR
ncbi:SsrA-binding protein [bacterium (candidate division B38) B3_B38]|nr:MAG: SsrA-binding protein [bacterium (candidate division B38) B3_B38]